MCSPKSRFHYPSGGSENHACSGAFLHQLVAGTVLQGSGSNVGGTNHPGQLPGSQNSIDVMSCVLFIVKLHFPLGFFGHAGHNGHRKNVFRFYPDGFGKIALHDCPEHLLGRFCRGELPYQVGVLGFEEPYPARAAGGKHGSGPQFTAVKPLQELIAFLHNR